LTYPAHALVRLCLWLCRGLCLDRGCWSSLLLLQRLVPQRGGGGMQGSRAFNGPRHIHRRARISTVTNIRIGLKRSDAMFIVSSRQRCKIRFIQNH